MQTFNPMLTEERVDDLIVEILRLKSEFDKVSSDGNDRAFLYSPKKPKLTYNNIKVF